MCISRGPVAPPTPSLPFVLHPLPPPVLGGPGPRWSWIPALLIENSRWLRCEVCAFSFLQVISSLKPPSRWTDLKRLTFFFLLLIDWFPVLSPHSRWPFILFSPFRYSHSYCAARISWSDFMNYHPSFNFPSVCFLLQEYQHAYIYSVMIVCTRQLMRLQSILAKKKKNLCIFNPNVIISLLYNFRDTVGFICAFLFTRIIEQIVMMFSN